MNDVEELEMKAKACHSKPGAYVQKAGIQVTMRER